MMMNKRVKELYMQALNESENMRWNIEDAERFAELIVDECVKVCAGVLDEYSPRAENKVGSEIQNNVDGAIIGCAMVVSNRIKKHFGVE
jgi:hypothetical protein